MHGRSHTTESTLMSKKSFFKVAKFSELIRFRVPAQPKLAEQWKEAQRVGKLKRADEHVFAINGSTYSAKTIRRTSREEQRNFGRCQSSVDSFLGIEREYETHQVSERSTSRIKRWTNTVVHHFAQDAPWVQKRIHLSVGRDLKSFGPKNLLKQKFTSRAC